MSKILRVCFVLVCIERFRSLLKDRDYGLEQKSIISTLVVFWVAAIIVEIVSWYVGYWDDVLPVVDDELKYILRGCTPTSTVTAVINLITKIIALTSFIVVITGCLVLVIKYKQTADRFKMAAIPILVVGVICAFHFFVNLSFASK